MGVGPAIRTLTPDGKGEIIFPVSEVAWIEEATVAGAPTAVLRLAHRPDEITFRGELATHVVGAIDEALRTADQPGVFHIARAKGSTKITTFPRKSREDFENESRAS